MTPKIEIDLIHILDRAGSQPFAWGTNDCNTLALEWLDRLQGSQWLKRVKGTYNDLRGAIRVAKSLPRWTDGLIEEGWTEIKKEQATIGDLAVVSGKSYDIIYIVEGSTVIGLVEDGEIVRKPIDTLEARFFGLRHG